MKRKGQGSKGHRRSYLPDGRMGHYELLRVQQHAIKFAALFPAASLQLATDVGKRLRTVAMNARSGTTGHLNAMGEVKRYAQALGPLRGTAYRITVAIGRAYTWARGRERSYRPTPRTAALPKAARETE